MKIKGIFSGFFCLFIVCCLAVCSALADISRVERDLETGEITVVGTISAAKAYEPVTVWIEKTEGGSQIMDMGTVSTDQNGDFSYKFKLTDGFTSYVAHVTGINFSADFSMPFAFYSESDIQTAFTAFKNAQRAVTGSEDTAKMEQALNDFSDVLDLDKAILSRISGKTAFYKRLVNSASVSSYNSIKELYMKTAITELFNQAGEGNIAGLLDEFKTVINISDSELYELYNDTAFSTNAKNAVHKKMAVGSFTAYSDIESLFYECVILKGVEFSPYYTTTAKLLGDNNVRIGLAWAAYNGLSTQAKKDTVMQGMTGYSATGYSDMVSQFAALVSAADSVAGGTGPTGGGGGGAGGGGGSGVSGLGSSGVSVAASATQGQVKIAFVDIEDVSWAWEAITELTNKGVINGKEEYFFMPNDNVTRTEFVKMLVGAFSIPFTENKMNFTDLGDDFWGYSYIQAAYNAGIVNGIGNGEFGINSEITREDMAVMIGRTLAMKGISLQAGGLSFSDNTSISDYARDSISRLYGVGIINGMGDGSFMPKESATRAQAAKIIYSSAILK